MTARMEGPEVPISEVDRARVRELRQTAVEALLRMNDILSGYAKVDANEITHVTIGLLREPDAGQDQPVPPVWTDPCVQYNSHGACAYFECDPPGVTMPCPPISLPE